MAAWPASRSPRTAAPPGTRATGRGSWTYTYLGHRPRRRHRQGPGRRRQRQHPVTRDLGHVTVSCPCSIFGLATVPTVARHDRRERGRARREVPVATSTAGSPASGSTRAPATPAPTPAACGPPTGTELATATFTNESASGWQQVGLRRPGRRQRRHHLRRLLPRAQRALRGRQQLLLRLGHVDIPPLKALINGGTSGEQRRVPVRRSRLPDGLATGPRTTGSTRCSPPSLLLTPSRPASAPAPLTGFVEQRHLDHADGHVQRGRPARVDLLHGDDTNAAAIAGTVSYNGTTRTATFTPSTALPNGTTLHRHGERGAGSGRQRHDLPVPVELHDRGRDPAARRVPVQHLERLGRPGHDDRQRRTGRSSWACKFTADADGTITGVRFYKGPSNTGVHTGTLWSSTGTASGHGDVQLRVDQWLADRSPSPPRCRSRPGTTYVASYHTNVGLLLGHERGLHVGQEGRQPAAARTDHATGGAQRRLSLRHGCVPHQRQRRQLLGRRRVRSRGRHLTPERRASLARDRCDQRRDLDTGQGHMSEAIQPGATGTLTGPGSTRREPAPRPTTRPRTNWSFTPAAPLTAARPTRQPSPERSTWSATP